MKRLTTTIILTLISAVAFSQKSAVVLSSFKVMEIIESSSGELNSFMLEVTVNDPLALNHFEVILADEEMMNFESKYYSVVVKDEKPALDMGKYSVPFEGSNIRFVIKVRNQFQEPYRKVIIKGYDKINKETNQLVYNRLTH